MITVQCHSTVLLCTNFTQVRILVDKVLYVEYGKVSRCEICPEI